MSHDIIVALHECLDIVCLWNVECDDASDFCMSKFWNCGCGVYIYICIYIYTYTHIYIYIYISVPKYFSVNAAEGVNCNVVFILSRAVLSVTFVSKRGFHFCTHSVHIIYTFCTHFCTHSVHISVHLSVHISVQISVHIL